MQSALGIEGVGTQVPWVALLSQEQRIEMRAATGAPADSDVIVANVLGRVFARRRGRISWACLILLFQSAQANYPVLSAGVSPANAAKSAAADQTAAVLTANVLNPLRLTAEYVVRYEDLNQLRMMEEALRADLQGAMMEAADKGVVAGDGTAPNVNGFINKLTDPTNPSTESAFADYASARAGLVDGRYAQSEDDVRILVGASTYAHAAGIYQTGSGTSALSRLSPRVSPHVPAVASTIQRAIASRSTNRAVAPMWPSISLIRDSVSRSGEGEIVITAIALWNFAILDESGYSLLEFKVA